jgi:hypothetical protein
MDIAMKFIRVRNRDSFGDAIARHPQDGAGEAPTYRYR